MVNALYSSKHVGSKIFKLRGVEFGWQAITDLWQRECARRENGNARMVPKLRESHVLKDSWTKLNVASAKIIQVSATQRNKSYHFTRINDYNYYILFCSRKRYYLSYTVTYTSSPHQVIKNTCRPHSNALKHAV